MVLMVALRSWLNWFCIQPVLAELEITDARHVMFQSLELAAERFRSRLLSEGHPCRHLAFSPWLTAAFTTFRPQSFRPQEGYEVLWWVCLFVCMSARVTGKLQGRTSPNFCACYLWPWLGLLWRRCDTLCTSGFVRDVTFSPNGPITSHVYS